MIASLYQSRISAFEFVYFCLLIKIEEYFCRAQKFQSKFINKSLKMSLKCCSAQKSLQYASIRKIIDKPAFDVTIPAIYNWIGSNINKLACIFVKIWAAHILYVCTIVCMWVCISEIIIRSVKYTKVFCWSKTALHNSR